MHFPKSQSTSPISLSFGTQKSNEISDSLKKEKATLRDMEYAIYRENEEKVKDVLIPIIDQHLDSLRTTQEKINFLEKSHEKCGSIIGLFGAKLKNVPIASDVIKSKIAYFESSSRKYDNNEPNNIFYYDFESFGGGDVDDNEPHSDFLNTINSKKIDDGQDAQNENEESLRTDDLNPCVVTKPEGGNDNDPYAESVVSHHGSLEGGESELNKAFYNNSVSFGGDDINVGMLQPAFSKAIGTSAAIENSVNNEIEKFIKSGTAKPDAVVVKPGGCNVNDLSRSSVVLHPSYDGATDQEIKSLSSKIKAEGVSSLDLSQVKLSPEKLFLLLENLNDSGLKNLNLKNAFSGLSNEWRLKNKLKLMAKIEETFRSNKELEYLNISANNFDFEMTEILARCQFLNLRKLDLGANPIADKGLEYLLQGQLLQLKELKLWKTGISSVGVDFLSQQKLHNLTYLNLSGNALGSVGIDKITNVNFPKLTRLSVGGTGLRAEDVSKFLQKNELQLTHLDLRNNNVGKMGAKALANSKLTLTYLGLDHAELGDVGLESLVKGNFNNLKRLELGGNQITSEGIKVLRNIAFPELEVLSLRKNVIESDGITNLLKCKFPKLTNLSLSQNSIDSNGLVFMLKEGNLEDVGNLKNLKQLDFSFNPIGDAAAYALVPMQLSKFEHLNLGFTGLTSAGMMLLMMVEFPGMKHLKLGQSVFVTEEMRELSRKQPYFIDL